MRKFELLQNDESRAQSADSSKTCRKPQELLFAIKTNSKIIRSQVSQPASAGKGADMSELQCHHRFFSF